LLAPKAWHQEAAYEAIWNWKVKKEIST
jgi:hypothetical protein